MVAARAISEHPVQRAQREAAGFVKLENTCGGKIRRDTKRVPANVNRLIYVGSWPAQARGIHLLPGRIEQRLDLFSTHAEAR